MEIISKRAQEVAGLILRPDSVNHPRLSLAAAGSSLRETTLNLYLSSLINNRNIQAAREVVVQDLDELLQGLPPVDAICSLSPYGVSFSTLLASELGLAHISADPQTRTFWRPDGKPVDKGVRTSVVFDSFIKIGKEVCWAALDLAERYQVRVPAIATIVNFRYFGFRNRLNKVINRLGHPIDVYSLTSYQDILDHPSFAQVFTGPNDQTDAVFCFRKNQRLDRDHLF